MRTLEQRSTDNPKLKTKILSDGRKSLYLEYYLGYNKIIDPETEEVRIVKNRRKKTLHLYLYPKPQNPIQREENRKNIAIAKSIRAEEELKMKGDQLGRKLIDTPKKDFFELFQEYNMRYDKKDYRMMTGAFNRFKHFIEEEYPTFKNHIMPDQLTREIIEEFVSYLQSHSKGEGASNYYQHFKKFIKHLCDNEFMRKNPCKGITCKVDKTVLRKPVLSDEEINALIHTEYKEQNLDIRRAFLFSIFTGVRFCDVKDLKYSNVDFSNEWILFEQNKTKGHSNTSSVTINITPNILQLIGKPKRDGENHIIDENIFKLPSYEACNKSLKRWSKKAGITKNITWHTARHSYIFLFTRNKKLTRNKLLDR